MNLITTKRAAELLHVTPVRVRQLIRQGRLPSMKEGRDHLLDEAVVRKFDRFDRRPGGRPRKSVK